MGRDALDADRGAACIEGFVDHFAELAAVDRVGEVDGELREVDLLGAEKADLLVGDEGDVDVAVRAEVPSVTTMSSPTYFSISGCSDVRIHRSFSLFRQMSPP